MSEILTIDGLRLELAHFARNEMRMQISAAIQEAMRRDPLPAIEPRSLQSARDAESFQLPGQPAVKETLNGKTLPKEVQEMASDSAATCQEAWIADDGDAHQGHVQPIETSEADDVTKYKSGLSSIVSTGSHLNEELNDMNYFDKRSSSNSELTPTSSPLSPTIRSAKEAMLRNNSDSRIWIKNLSIKQSSGYKRFAERSCTASLVMGARFETCVLLVILLNTIFIAIQTEVAVSDYSASQAPAFKVMDWIFLSIFAVELGLRLFVFRMWFFSAMTPWGQKNTQRNWNVFDAIIVISQALELLSQEITESGVFGSVTVLRLLRTLRLGRLFRVGKVVQYMGSLRTIVTSIYFSLQLFFWSVISLAVMGFVFAVYFTELVALEFKKGEVDPDLKRHFGSLPASQLSLLQAVTGGIDWGELEVLLRSKVDFTFAALPFLCYLMFTLIVTMNVFTGIFLDSASQRAQEENEIHMLRNAYQIFQSAEHEVHGQITWVEFKRILTHADVEDFFSALGLDIQQAKVLFELLDSSDDGFISCQEFLRGCLRLKGSAKALDLLILSREVGQNFDALRKFAKQTAEATSMNQTMLTHVLQHWDKVLQSRIQGI